MRIRTAWMCALLALAATPAYAQFGKLGDRLRQAQEARDKLAELKMSDADERRLGEQVSLQLRQQFGVFQDKNVARYVSLVGSVLAGASSRPALDWQFVVLDTEGVNAFAAPGGIVHITRGALGLIKNEAELAGVLGHEITHVTAKHTVRSIQKNKAVTLTAEEVGGSRGLSQSVVSRLAEAAYKNVINNAFDRDDEIEADRVGIALASRAGYAPAALSSVLQRLEDRNQAQEQPNGMFASHPLIRDRIANIAKVAKEQKLAGSATVAARYGKHVTFDVKPLGDIPVIDGTRGLTGGSSKNAQQPANAGTGDKKEPAKKKGGLLGKVGLTSGSQSQNTQTVASAGARGLGQPDRDAKGGSNPSRVPVDITPADLGEFKKGIV
jgi:beta-barrel assembly-enhancing protease